MYVEILLLFPLLPYYRCYEDDDPAGSFIFRGFPFASTFLIRINYRPCANRSAISHFFIQQIQCWACGCKGPHEHGQKKGRKARTITISSLKMRWCDFFSFNRAKIITAQTIWFSVYNRRVHISMAGSIEGMSAQVFSATSCSLKQELYKRGNGNMKGFQAYNEHWRYPCKDLVK